MKVSDINPAHPFCFEDAVLAATLSAVAMVLCSMSYGERDVTAQQVVDRLRPRLAEVPGARLFLSAVQDIRVGGRQANAKYQFTLRPTARRSSTNGRPS